jgi:hypothetical protein
MRWGTAISPVRGGGTGPYSLVDAGPCSATGRRRRLGGSFGPGITTSKSPVRGSSARRTGSNAIGPDEVGEVEGIPVTSLFRTVLDLAATRPRREGELALHELQRKEKTDAISFDELLGRHPGHRGAATVRRLRASKAPLSVPRNIFEEAFVAFIDEYGLPRPEINAPLVLEERNYEIDALWRPQRLAAELDGRETHDTDDVYESDRQRDRDLLVAGWRTTRITWRHLHGKRAQLAADLRILLTL